MKCVRLAQDAFVDHNKLDLRRRRKGNKIEEERWERIKRKDGMHPHLLVFTPTTPHT